MGDGCKKPSYARKNTNKQANSLARNVERLSVKKVNNNLFKMKNMLNAINDLEMNENGIKKELRKMGMPNLKVNAIASLLMNEIYKTSNKSPRKKRKT